MVNAASRKLADESMAQIRRFLSMPDPEQALWSGMTKKQRIVILMASGISSLREPDHWDAFSVEQRQAMFDQINAFGRLAAKLRGIRGRCR